MLSMDVDTLLGTGVRQALRFVLTRSGAAISGDLLSAVISICYIFGFRKDNPNVFNSLIQSWPYF